MTRGKMCFAQKPIVILGMAAEWKCCQDVPGRLLRGGRARFAAVRSPTMPDTVNRGLRLRRRPVGRIAPDDFELVRAPVPTAGPGEAVVRNLYLSLDPTNRIWVEDVEQYMPPVQLGDVMFDTILMKRLRVQGFIVIDYLPRFAEAITQLAQWMAEGKAQAPRHDRRRARARTRGAE